MNRTENREHPAWQGGALCCLERKDETHDSASFTLVGDVPARFHFKPGQFATIGVDIGGQRHYRAYSMSSSPDSDDAITVTIRRVPDGVVSNFMLDHFRVGDRLDALALAGDFCLSETDLGGKMVMLAAGSGITPLMSMARWALRRKPDADIHVIYSARTDRDIIFLADLLGMKMDFQNFRFDLFLDQPSEIVPSHTGFLNAERLDALIDDPASCRYYLCGNPAYMEMVEGWHRTRGLPADRIHKESFDPGRLPATGAVEVETVYQMSVPAFGKTTDIRSNQTLLEIMEQNAVPIIGACRSGVCGSCKCKVTEGAVARLSTATLTPEELEAGYALACSALPQSDIAVELVI